MSDSNGVIRIGKKGIKKFAFGDAEPFEVEIVGAWQKWLVVDESFRPPQFNEDGTPNENRNVSNESAGEYYKAAQDFVKGLGAGDVTPAEALEFLARLKEEWDNLITFFRPRSRDERDSPDFSDSPSAELQFSEEPAT